MICKWVCSGSGSLHCSAASLRHGRYVSFFTRAPGLWLVNHPAILSSDWLMGLHQCPLRLTVTAPPVCCDLVTRGAALAPLDPGNWFMAPLSPQAFLKPSSIPDDEICLHNTILSGWVGLHAVHFQLWIQNRWETRSNWKFFPLEID